VGFSCLAITNGLGQPNFVGGCYCETLAVVFVPGLIHVQAYLGGTVFVVSVLVSGSNCTASNAGTFAYYSHHQTSLDIQVSATAHPLKSKSAKSPFGQIISTVKLVR
jgi:hypothetical protein